MRRDYARFHERVKDFSEALPGGQRVYAPPSFFAGWGREFLPVQIGAGSPVQGQRGAQSVTAHLMGQWGMAASIAAMRRLVSWGDKTSCNGHRNGAVRV
jgi:hypothetical protein